MYKYGWKRDLPDFRDYKYFVRAGVALPGEVDLRKPSYPIVDQYELGSCVGNGIANVHHAVQIIQGKSHTFYPSRLFIYFNSRALEGTTGYDSGATIRDGIKTVVKQGVCDEALWPYNIGRFTRRPTINCYKQALDNQVVKYESVPQDLYSLKYTLAQGFPIVAGMMVYSSFESEEVEHTGIVPMPSSGESDLGGHCFSIFGYSDKKRHFICMNSWGEEWGDRGWFYLDYDYLTNINLASDFWVIKLVE